jgi:hypothetical protein
MAFMRFTIFPCTWFLWLTSEAICHKLKFITAKTDNGTHDNDRHVWSLPTELLLSSVFKDFFVSFFVHQISHPLFLRHWRKELRIILQKIVFSSLRYFLFNSNCDFYPSNFHGIKCLKKSSNYYWNKKQSNMSVHFNSTLKLCRISQEDYFHKIWNSHWQLRY